MAGTALTGLQVQNTYSGLLKTSDNAAISTSFRTITDGLGNDTGLQLTDKLVKSGFALNRIAYSAGDATPSVAGLSYMEVTNASPVTITNFDDGVEGQVVVLYFTDGNTTIDRSNCYLAGGANFTSTANDTLTIIKTVSGVWAEVARSVNS